MVSEPKQKTIEAELTEFLSMPRPATPCKYSREVSQPLKDAIRSKVEAGVQRWASYQRFLAAHQIYIAPDTIKQHFARGHSDER